MKTFDEIGSVLRAKADRTGTIPESVFVVFTGSLSSGVNCKVFDSYDESKDFSREAALSNGVAFALCVVDGAIFEDTGEPCPLCDCGKNLVSMRSLYFKDPLDSGSGN